MDEGRVSLLLKSSEVLCSLFVLEVEIFPVKMQKLF